MSPHVPHPRPDQPPHPRRLQHRDVGLRRAKHLTAWTAAGGLAMSGGLAVLAEHAFSGVRRIATADPTDTDPATTASVPPAPLPAVVPGTTAPIETLAPAVIPATTAQEVPTEPAPTASTAAPTTAPPVTVAPIVPPTVAPTAPPTTVAQRRRHRTTVTTGGS